MPWMIKSSPSISTLAPLTDSSAAVADRRSLSLTRSSFNPRSRVVPVAQDAVQLPGVVRDEQLRPNSPTR